MKASSHRIISPVSGPGRAGCAVLVAAGILLGGQAGAGVRHELVAKLNLRKLYGDRMPKQVRLSPDGKLALIPCMATQTIVVFSTSCYGRLKSIKSPAEMPVECTWSDDSARAYVQCMNPGVLLELDMVKMGVARKSARHGRWPKVVEFTPNRKELWVSDWLGRSVNVISPDTLECLRKIRVARTPRGIGFLKGRPRAYVANFAEYHPEAATITEIDTGTYKVVKTFGSLRGGPRHVTVSPDDRFVYVSNMFRNVVHVIDTEKDVIVANIPAGRHPKSTDLTPDGLYLYVADFNEEDKAGSVSVIDTGKRAVVAVLKAGLGTTGLDVSPDGNYLWITNIGDSTLWVYRIIRD